MSGKTDTSPCSAPDGGLDLASPYCALNYHFGMLLGVDDFTTEQSYHRGKTRLHNAWLHRDGVIWGLDVRLDPARGEIRVLPGLALDPAGRELHLDADQCLNVGLWYEANSDKIGRQPAANDVSFEFDAYVALRFRACLTRQVPAMTEPCEGAGGDTAYSRVFETVEILLVPGAVPPPDYPYHRLRLLAGIDVPRKDNGVVIGDDQEVLDERERILGLPPDQQPQELLKAFRGFAARDEISMEPKKSADGARASLFPGDASAAVPLAGIKGLKVEKRAGHWVGTGGTVDTAIRPVLVATSAIQELLCGLAPGGAPYEASLGPRVDRQSVVVGAQQISFKVDSALDPGSVKPEAFAVGWYDAQGWHAAVVAQAAWDAPNLTVKLDLQAALAGQMVRFIARGTGERPLLGANMVPLGGLKLPSATSQRGGSDFVYLDERR